MFVGIFKAEMLAHYGSKAGFIRRFSIGNEPLDSILSGVYRIDCEPVVFTIEGISAGTLALAGGVIGNFCTNLHADKALPLARVVGYGSGRHLEAPLKRVGGGKRLFRYVYKITKRYVFVKGKVSFLCNFLHVQKILFKGRVLFPDGG